MCERKRTSASLTCTSVCVRARACTSKRELAHRCARVHERAQALTHVGKHGKRGKARASVGKHTQ
eukprot:10979562-Alexandrium_andersonii.AAC.1